MLMWQSLCQALSQNHSKGSKRIKSSEGVTIGGLVRSGEGMLVSGNTQIEAGDSVVVFCYNVDMKKVEKLFI